MLLLDARHGFKKLDIEFLEILYDPKGPSPLGEFKESCSRCLDMKVSSESWYKDVATAGWR